MEKENGVAMPQCIECGAYTELRNVDVPICASCADLQDEVDERNRTEGKNTKTGRIEG
jgi:hypothetical protein